jgi:hypothetical protein
MTQNCRTERQVASGLDYILSHLGKPDWPRTISTKLTEGKQITAHSRIEALSYFKDANYQDCRISAYNKKSLERNNGTASIEFLLIDLDLATFKSSKRELDKAKDNTLSAIYNEIKLASTKLISKRKKLTITKKPSITVVWSGNGYHIYVALDSQGIILENPKHNKLLSKIRKLTKEPSKEFLRYIEYNLSSNKCDNDHNKTVSCSNCMVRIPGSFNSKNGKQVKILQKWDGESKLAAHKFYDRFVTHLMARHAAAKTRDITGQTTRTSYLQQQQLQQKQPQLQLLPRNNRIVKLFQTFRENKNRKHNQKWRRRQYYPITAKNDVYSRHDNGNENSNGNGHGTIPWIETLLKIPLQDYRKYCIWKILGPYLINKRGLSFEEAFTIIDAWLVKCDEIKPLDFKKEARIKNCLKFLIEDDEKYYPISFHDPTKENTLKTTKKELYDIVVAADPSLSSPF